MQFSDFENGSVVMFFGDSTTDCGRGRPYGDYKNGLGESYAKRIYETVTAAYPEKLIKFVNAGISGETSRDVRRRFVTDMETIKPDYATLLIGVNDVWRHYDRAYDGNDFAVDIDEYEDNIRFMAKYAKEHCKGFCIITPFFFELNKKETFMKAVSEYADVCKKVAAEENVDFINLQPEIDRLIKGQYTYFYTADRVHPNGVVHTAIANYILKKWKFK